MAYLTYFTQIMSDIYENDNDLTSPKVAYNRDDASFLVGFREKSFLNKGIYAQRIDGSGPTLIGDTFAVSSFWLFEVDCSGERKDPAVAFSGGTENLSGNYADHFLISYTCGDSSDFLMSRGIIGHHQSSGSQRLNYSVLDTKPVGVGSSVGPSDVTGNSKNGRYLVVWQSYMAPGIPRAYIYGTIISSQFGEYLPIIIKNP